MEKLKHNYPKGPNVSFHSIHVLNHSLWRHIQRGSNIKIEKILTCIKKDLLVGVLGKSKISYFTQSIVHKYVGYFQIPMHYSSLT